MFRDELIGRGIAILPEDGTVSAPCSGVIRKIYQSGNAISLSADSGAEILLQAGICLNHESELLFYPAASEGMHIEQGDLLLQYDLQKVKETGAEPVLLLVITNPEQYFITCRTGIRVSSEKAIMKLERRS